MNLQEKGDSPDQYDRLSSLARTSLSQSGRLMPLHSKADFRTSMKPAIARLVFLRNGDRPSQTARHESGPGRCKRRRILDIREIREVLSAAASIKLAHELQTLPPILQHARP